VLQDTASRYVTGDAIKLRGYPDLKIRRIISIIIKMLARDNPICSKCKGDKNKNGFTKESICRSCMNERSRLYKKEHKKEISAYNKKYKSDHRDEISEYNSKYSKENQASIQARVSERKKTDPQFKLRISLANRVKNALSSENHTALSRELLGSSVELCKEWLEFQFKEDMTFENHGKVWHIDHIIPCAKFELVDPDEQHKCFNWANLQPLYVKENLSKSANIRIKDIENNKKMLDKFLKMKKEKGHKIPKLIEFDRNEYL